MESPPKKRRGTGTMKAVQIDAHGGVEALVVREVEKPVPKAGEALVKVAASGVNFIDTYHRSGLYKLANFPSTIGVEGAGEVVALGEGVSGVAVGDKVAWWGAMGSYAEFAAVPVAKLVPVPAGVTLDQACTTMVQGLTAHYLCTSTFPLKEGHTCLVHAAAGGTGLMITQIAKIRGARVIGTVGTPEKAELARAHGCDEIIFYRDVDFAEKVKELTGGRGVDVVYDGVGAATFEKSLDSLARLGYMVTFGNASGPVPPVSALELTKHGSLFLTRPSLADYTATRESGYTPLHEAAFIGHTDAINALVAAGAEVNAVNENGETPLHVAAYCGRAEAINALAAAGAEVNAVNKGGWTPLHSAAEFGRTEAINTLAAAGAEVNAVTKEGWTPLHEAAFIGHTDAINALAAAGAEVNAVNEDGDTPLALAKRNYEQEAVAALAALGGHE